MSSDVVAPFPGRHGNTYEDPLEARLVNARETSWEKAMVVTHSGDDAMIKVDVGAKL